MDCKFIGHAWEYKTTIINGKYTFPPHFSNKTYCSVFVCKKCGEKYYRFQDDYERDKPHRFAIGIVVKDTRIIIRNLRFGGCLFRDVRTVSNYDFYPKNVLYAQRGEYYDEKDFEIICQENFVKEYLEKCSFYNGSRFKGVSLIDYDTRCYKMDETE